MTTRPSESNDPSDSSPPTPRGAVLGLPGAPAWPCPRGRGRQAPPPPPPLPPRPAVNRREGPRLPKEAEPGVTHKGTDRRFHTGRAGLSHTHARAHTHRKPTPHSCAEGRLGFQERTHPPRVPEPLPLHCRSCPGPAVQAQGHGGHGIKVRGCGLVGPECAASWTGREGGRGATHPLAGEAEGRVPGLGGGGSGLLGRAPSSAVVPAQPSLPLMPEETAPLLLRGQLPFSGAAAPTSCPHRRRKVDRLLGTPQADPRTPWRPRMPGKVRVAGVWLWAGRSTDRILWGDKCSQRPHKCCVSWGLVASEV